MRWWCMKNGNKIFSSYGIYDRKYLNWQTNQDSVQRWKNGMTGMPIVDALMRELNATGFMPNRGRMIVASYLVCDLKQDWRFGAYHFEETLIDHDVQSNYGNWALQSLIAGRAFAFNTLIQSPKFDGEGKYIRLWVPELESVPTALIHSPWDMPLAVQKKCGVQIG